MTRRVYLDVSERARGHTVSWQGDNKAERHIRRTVRDIVLSARCFPYRPLALH